MIDPRNIEKLQIELDPLFPPIKTVGTHPLPIVRRISPELAGFAEIIGRHTGDEFRFAVRFELKKIAVAPNVRRIESDVDRNVADDGDAFFPGKIMQLFPLLKERELVKFLRKYRVVQVRLRRHHRVRFATLYRRVPFGPALVAVRVAVRLQEGVILEPPIIYIAERVEFGGDVRVVRRSETLKSFDEEIFFESDRAAVIYL